jgi:glycogen synthase
MSEECGKQNMRILQVAPEYPPNSIGGGGQVIKALTMGLLATGCQLTVLSAEYNVRGVADKPHNTKVDGIDIMWLPLVPAPNVGFQLRSYLPPNLFSAIDLLRVFLRRDFDVVHIHGLGHFLCDFAGVLSKLSGKPYVYTVHGFPKEPRRRGGLLRAIYTVYIRILGAPVLRNASRVVAVSNSLADEIATNFPGVVTTTIMNGINPSCCVEPSETKIREVMAKYKLQGKMVILGLGRLCEGKGFQFAVKALPKVQLEFPLAHLVIAGGNDGYDYSRELIRFVEECGVKNSVSFVGNVTDFEEKNALLWQAKVVVIPSLEESFGLVASEAMAAGRPVVASRIGALNEILGNDKCSRQVEPGNVEEIADALTELMDNSDLQREAKATRFQRLGRFDMNRMAKSYADLYAALTEKL